MVDWIGDTGEGGKAGSFNGKRFPRDRSRDFMDHFHDDSGEVCVAWVRNQWPTSGIMCGWSIPAEAARFVYTIRPTEEEGGKEEGGDMAVCVGEFDDVLGRMQRFTCGSSRVPSLLGMRKVALGERLCDDEAEIPVRNVADLVQCTPLERATSALLPPIPGCLIYNDPARLNCAFMDPDHVLKSGSLVTGGLDPSTAAIEGIQDLWIKRVDKGLEGEFATCSVDRATKKATCSSNSLQEGQNGLSAITRVYPPEDMCTPTERPIMYREGPELTIRCEQMGFQGVSAPLPSFDPLIL